MNNLIYVGIGSRKTPNNILKIMRDLGMLLAINNYVLRSGGAIGADNAFEIGCDDKHGKKIIFNANNYYQSCDVYSTYYNKKLLEAETIAKTHHPNWEKLTPYVKRLHRRNVFQILGLNLQTLADFVLCWTPDGAKHANQTSFKSGGTGQAIRVASTYGIKVYNFAVTADLELASSWLATFKM